jgi:hypothetical protein
MDRIRRATLRSYRENGMKDEREAPERTGSRKKTGGDDRGRRTDPVTVPSPSKPVA